MKSRLLSHAITDAMLDTPIIALIGARQVGKTTLAKTFVPDKLQHRVSLDDQGLRELADSDPSGFIDSLKIPAMIDEIQKSPNLTSNIKLRVDENRQPGAFIITGSADLRSLSFRTAGNHDSIVGDSMAGRVEWLTLFTLTQAEIKEHESSFLTCMMNRNFSQQETKSLYPLSRETLIDMIVAGGYPEVLNRSVHRRKAWFKNYLDSIIRQDLRDVYAIEKSEEALKTLQLLAINSSNLLNKSSIYKHVGIAKETGNRFIAAMSSIYLVHYLPAFSKNQTKALVAAPKIITLDSGLHCYLLDQNSTSLAFPSEIFGRIFENFVIAEIIKLNSYAQEPGHLSHYRSRDGRIEIDLIYSLNGQEIGIEIKSGMSIQASWKKSLSQLINDGTIEHGYIIYPGKQLVTTSDNVTYLPVSYLFE